MPGAFRNVSCVEGLGPVVVNQFKGRGRRAVTVAKLRSGGWLFRLYMAWFFHGIDKRRP